MLNWQTEARDGSFRTAPGSVYHLDFEDMVRLGEKFMELTPKTPKIFYIWGHSYEMDFGANYWVKLEEFFKLISHKDDIFYGTNKEVLL